jgi:peptidoglycan hydrolase CwlO-like protein
VVKLQKPGLFFIFSLIVAITLASVLPNRISGQARPVAEAQQKLKGISENEKSALEGLFILLQEIEEMDREQAEIEPEIQAMQVQIQDVQRRIEHRERDYDNQLDILKQVLVSYQRQGPASYLKILLSAEDLTSFLRSINIIRDLTRNTGGLLASLEEGKKKLTAEKKSLANSMALLEAKREEFGEALAKKLQLKEEQEAYLESLEGEREYYRGLLGDLQSMWDDIKILFSEIVGEFTKIIGDGKFPVQDLNLSFGFLTVKGTIHEKTLNDMLKEHSSLPEMIFHFYPGKTEIEVPEKHLILTGTFSVEKGSALKFEAEEGSFYGMELGPASIEELFRDGYLLIDFSGLMGDITLQSVKVYEGYMEFVVKPGF